MFDASGYGEERSPWRSQVGVVDASLLIYLLFGSSVIVFQIVSAREVVK